MNDAYNAQRDMSMSDVVTPEGFDRCSQVMRWMGDGGTMDIAKVLWPDDPVRFHASRMAIIDYVIGYGWPWLRSKATVKEDVEDFDRWTTKALGFRNDAMLLTPVWESLKLIHRCPTEDDPSVPQFGIDSAVIDSSNNITYYHDADDPSEYRYIVKELIKIIMLEWSDIVKVGFREVHDKHSASVIITGGGTFGRPIITNRIISWCVIHRGSVVNDDRSTVYYRIDPSVTCSTGNGIMTIKSILSHCIGHALGLRHSSHPLSIMNPLHEGTIYSPQIAEDRLAGLSLYVGRGKPFDAVKPAADQTEKLRDAYDGWATQ